MNNFEQLRQEVEQLPAELEGVTMSHLLALPDPLGRTLRRLVRRRSTTIDQFAEALAITETEAARLLQLLQLRGYVHKGAGTEPSHYKVHFAPKFSSASVPDRLWQSLDDL
jgi:hypothetical protein